jgi:hypothetical protein
LTTAHKSRKILSSIAEQAVASLEGDGRRSTFRLRKLGDAEEGNLHTLKKTNAAHKNDEEDERDGIRKSFPGRGLSAVEGLDGDGKGEAKKSAREKNTSPEEGESDSGLRRFVGLDRLSGGGGDNHVDKVGGVHDSGNLNTGGDSVGEGHEVGVDVVKHHVGSIALRSELSDDNILQNHSNTRSEEDGSDPVRKSENIGSRKRSSAKSDGEVDEDNHELTSHEVSVEVVSLVSPSGDLVGDRVRFTVKFAVDWRKTNHGALSSLNHGHPDDKRPHDNSGGGRVNIAGKLCVTGTDQRQNDDDRKGNKEKRDYNS